MSVSVNIDSHVPEFLSELGVKLPAALEAIGAAGETNAKKHITEVVYNTPQKGDYVRTGRLRNSIAHAVDIAGSKAYIGTNVEYGPAVEMGTSKMRPRPFLKPAATEHGDEYKEIAKRIMQSGG